MSKKRRFLVTVAAAVAFHGNVVCLFAALVPVENHQRVSSTVVNTRDEMPIMFVPAGPFIMGSNDGFPNERPEHTVTLRPYFIDQFEVTTRRYQKFVESLKREGKVSRLAETRSALNNLPAVGVSWTDAVAYCLWAGRRLPTEAEWEKAARGLDRRRYPWGDMQPFVDIANYNRGQWVSDEVTLVPVDSGLEGMSVRYGLKDGEKSSYGLFHMAGNAAEWVADWYDRDYYRNSPDRDPTGAPAGTKRVIRGGSWADLPTALRVTARFSAEPDFVDRTIGFRCAMDAGE